MYVVALQYIVQYKVMVRFTCGGDGAAVCVYIYIVM